MQTPIQSGVHTRLANKRFEHAIAQDALDRLTSNATHRILSRDASRIYTAPPAPLMAGRRFKSTEGRLQVKPVGRGGGQVSGIPTYSDPSGGAAGSTENGLPKNRLYAQASRIIGSAPVRRPGRGVAPTGPWPPGSVFEYGSPANRRLSRQIEERLEAVAEWLRGPFTAEVRHSEEKEALVGMAKKDKKTGISKGDMDGYIDLNKELPDPFDERQVRGPEAHPNRPSPQAKRPHGHVGPVHHIPVK